VHTHVSPRVAQHASAWTTRWPAHISTRACSSSHVDGTDEILQRVKVGRRRCWSAQSNADTPDQLAGVQAPVPRTHTVPAVTKTVEPELQPRCAATWGVHGSASGGCMAAPGGASVARWLADSPRPAPARATAAGVGPYRDYPQARSPDPPSPFPPAAYSFAIPAPRHVHIP
jgi:hypothetical protein